ncbi:hypothetical protein C0995_013474 [Termitomyces sp. Mi166|nr:hypothetical protein C0995_013474 [Termitomyces sp. Mi166\
MSTLSLYRSSSPKTRLLRSSSLSGVANQNKTLFGEDDLIPYVQNSVSLPCTTIFTPLAQRYYGSSEEIEDTTLYFETPSFADITACISGPVILTKLADSQSISVGIVSVSPINSVRPSTSVDEVFSSLSFQVSRREPVPYIPSIISSVERVCDSASGRPLPRAIGSYDIMGTLGNGIHGEVVLASPKERTNSDFYAVKMLRNVEKREVLREISILKLIREWSDSRKAHDGGVHFLQKFQEVFEDDHVQFLVLEYHPATLSDPEIASGFRLTSDKHSRLSISVSLPSALDHCLIPSLKPSLEETVQSVRLLIAEISLGLAFLHARGLVHQDIKPANILLSYTGHVVIGDFGATSKMPLVSSGHDGPSLDADTDHYGPIVLDADDFVTFTPLYAAPEIKEQTLHGQVIYDYRSDWWSLGVLLYELVTGTVPFKKMADAELILNGRRSDGDRSLTFGELETLSDRLREKNITWYLGLDHFLRSLLSHNTEDRLSWPDVRKHEFLSPLRGLWEDIADLKHPPCPKLPTSRFRDETHSPMVDHDDDVHDVESILPVPLSSQDDFFGGLLGTAHKASFDSDDLFQPSSSLPLSVMETWELHQPPGIHDSDSDESSIPQALPSSASIWACGHTRNTSISESELYDSGCDVCSHTFDASSTVDKMKYTVATSCLPSLFSSPPVLDFDYRQHSGLRGSSYSTSSQHAESSVACGDLIALEDITWSLIEAMDYRDQLTWERERGQHRSGKLKNKADLAEIVH